MPTSAARIFPGYAAALLTAYEEEIAGEGYFAGLADQFSGRPRQTLLRIARMERVTAGILRPLVESHRLRAAGQAELLARGRAEADAQRGIAWDRLTLGMASDYPRYIAEFDQLSRLAPPADRTRVAVAVEHELALIDFARREAAGDAGSLEPVERFLSRHDGTGAAREG